MKKYDWLMELSAYGVIAVSVFLFFYRLLFPVLQLIITPDFGQSDAVTSFSTKYFLGTQLLHHHLPLWTTLIGGGYPIYAHGSMGTFFLPNLIFFSVLPPTYAYTLVLLFCVCMLGWGMYWWLRLMQYTRLPAIFGALSLALGGYIISQFTHMTIVQSLSLFPVIAGCTYLLAVKKSWFTAGVLSLLLAQQILIGFPQSVFITVLFITAYYIWLTRKSTSRIPDSARFILSLIASVGVSAVQLIPSLEYMSSLVSSAGFSGDAATLFSYPVKHLITLFHPFLLGNPAIGTYPHFLAFGGSIFWENTGYIGIIPLIFIPLYFLLTKTAKKSPSPRSRSVVFFAAIAGAAFFLMTGKHSPFYFVFSLWPFNIFRVPSRFIWVFDVALVIVCVHTFEASINCLKRKQSRLVVSVFVIALQLLTVFIIWSPYHNLEPMRAWLETPSLREYIENGGYTITIGGERAYSNTYQSHGWSTTDPKDHPSYILRNTFTPDKSMLWGVPQIRDYAGRYIRRSKVLDDLLTQTITTDEGYATISALGSKLLTTLSVKTVISTLALTQKGLVSHASLTDKTHMVNLYTNPEALPKVYIASSTIPVKTIDEAVSAFTSDAFIPGESVLTEDGVSFSSEPAGNTVGIDSQSEGSYTLTATNNKGRAILVLTETYYPGWHARVDNKEASVFPVNVKHIGVELPEGRHQVSLYYLPSSFILGAWISGITSIVIIALIVFCSFLGL